MPCCSRVTSHLIAFNHKPHDSKEPCRIFWTRLDVGWPNQESFYCFTVSTCSRECSSRLVGTVFQRLDIPVREAF